MNLHAHRDQNGRVVVNGTVGAVMEWLRWAMPIIVIPLIIWGVRAEVFHQEIRDFMQSGPRLTPDMLELRLQKYRSEVIQYMGDNYPPESLVSKVDANSEKLNELQVQMARMEERQIVIQRLLEDD
ncbi:MAG: hypothetical protein ACYTG5_21095 [Planctomycetota bacterium]|jgi:hypothetical protein